MAETHKVLQEQKRQGSGWKCVDHRRGAKEHQVGKKYSFKTE